MKNYMMLIAGFCGICLMAQDKQSLEEQLKSLPFSIAHELRLYATHRTNSQLSQLIGAIAAYIPQSGCSAEQVLDTVNHCAPQGLPPLTVDTLRRSASRGSHANLSPASETGTPGSERNESAWQDPKLPKGGTPANFRS